MYKLVEGTEFSETTMQPRGFRTDQYQQAVVGNGICAIGWGENLEEAKDLAIYLHEFYRLGGTANSSAEEIKRIDKLVKKKLKKEKR